LRSLTFTVKALSFLLINKLLFLKIQKKPAANTVGFFYMVSSKKNPRLKDEDNFDKANHIVYFIKVTCPIYSFLPSPLTPIAFIL
jgi:hypothetical protein